MKGKRFDKQATV